MNRKKINVILATLCSCLTLCMPVMALNTISEFQIRTSVHESTLNEYFETLLPIKEEGHIDGAIVKGTYKWTVTKLTAHIHQQMMVVKAEVDIVVENKKETATAVGRLKVLYDKNNNRIVFDIPSLTFDIKSNVYNNNIKLKSVDLAKYVSPSFGIYGPTPTVWENTVNLPNGKKRVLKTSPVSFEYIVEDKYISVLSKFEYLDAPKNK